MTFNLESTLTSKEIIHEVVIPGLQYFVQTIADKRNHEVICCRGQFAVENVRRKSHDPPLLAYCQTSETVQLITIIEICSSDVVYIPFGIHYQLPLSWIILN